MRINTVDKQREARHGGPKRINPIPIDKEGKRIPAKYKGKIQMSMTEATALEASALEKRKGSTIHIL